MFTFLKWKTATKLAGEQAAELRAFTSQSCCEPFVTGVPVCMCLAITSRVTCPPPHSAHAASTPTRVNLVRFNNGTTTDTKMSNLTGWQTVTRSARCATPMVSFSGLDQSANNYKQCHARMRTSIIAAAQGPSEDTLIVDRRRLLASAASAAAGALLASACEWSEHFSRPGCDVWRLLTQRTSSAEPRPPHTHTLFL